MNPCALALLPLLATPLFARTASDAAAPPGPVKVFILAGQSNMEGQAVVDLKGDDYNQGKGTLVALLDDPVKSPLVRHLRAEDGTWTVRSDVWVRYQPE